MATPVVNVRDFGAKGDGITNDTAAFQCASYVLNNAGGGTLIIPPGTYVVGRQYYDPNPDGPYFKPEPIVEIKDCKHPVVIRGIGRPRPILRAANGLKYGSFDQNGQPVDPLKPVDPPAEEKTEEELNELAQKYGVIAYWGMINLTGNTNKILVDNLELDGNIAGLELGGSHTHYGTCQCATSGIHAEANHHVEITHVYTHHHGLDGIFIGHSNLNEADPPYPHTILNVVSEYNGHQCQATPKNCTS